MLRDLTRLQHEELDQQVGRFDSRAAYSRYLLGIALFRDTVEPYLRRVEYPLDFGGWRPTLIQAELREDLADLRLEKPVYNDGFFHPEDFSELLGVLYVIEGSTLGARVLVKDAAALGFDATSGARHLATQSSHPDSWIAFQHILEDATPFDAERAAHAAARTFEAAHRAFRRIGHVEYAG